MNEIKHFKYEFLEGGLTFLLSSYKASLRHVLLDLLSLEVKTI